MILAFLLLLVATPAHAVFYTDVAPPCGRLHLIDMNNDAGCAIRQGEQLAVCWGDEAATGEPTVTPAGVTFSNVAVDFSPFNACGVIESSGHVQCWGYNIGLYSPNVIANAPTDQSYTQVIALESNVYCAIKAADGQLVCWGTGEVACTATDCATSVVAQSPPVYSVTFNTPTNVDSFTQVSAGGGQGIGCGIKTDGSIACFGAGNTLSNDAANFWGADSLAYLYNNIPSGTNFIDIDVQSERACALRSTGVATCWSLDDEGSADSTIPVGHDYIEIVALQAAACGIKRADNEPECWGDMTGWIAVPSVPVAGISSATATVCSKELPTMRYRCWGSDTSNQGDLISTITCPPPSVRSFIQ